MEIFISLHCFTHRYFGVSTVLPRNIRSMSAFQGCQLAGSLRMRIGTGVEPCRVGFSHKFKYLLDKFRKLMYWL